MDYLYKQASAELELADYVCLVKQAGMEDYVASQLKKVPDAMMRKAEKLKGESSKLERRGNSLSYKLFKKSDNSAVKSDKKYPYRTSIMRKAWNKADDLNDYARNLRYKAERMYSDAARVFNRRGTGKGLFIE